jgi:outer membrane cobalamin receptor
MGFRLKRRPHRLTLFVAVAVASCFASSALAQGTGDIIGRVVDAETGSPLPFASVGIANSVLGANSQQDGGFLIRGLAPGRYTLRASYIGYEEQELTVTVEAFRATEANFRLSPKSAAGKVDTVLVTGERPLVDVAEVSTVRRTTADEIAKLPVDDLFDVVERQIGVTGDNEELHIRGGRTDETLFQIDDVAMKNVITGGAVGGSFSAKAMQNVEVITGGYQAEYGQAISGIVRAELKEAGDVTRTSVEYQTGSFDTQRFFLQTEGPLLPQDGNYPIPGQLSFLLGIDALATDTYLPSLRDATDYDNPLRRTLRSGHTNSFAGITWSYDDFLRPRQDNSMNIYAKLTWRATPRHKLNLTFTKFVNLDHCFTCYRVGDEVLDAASDRGGYNYSFRDQMDQFPTITEETSTQVFNWRWALSNRAYSNFTFSHFYNNQEEAVQGRRPWVPEEEYDAWVPTGRDTFFVADQNGDFPRYINFFDDRYSFKFNLTHRWQEHHEFKGGFETSYHTLQMINIQNPTEGEGGLGSVRDLYRVNPSDGAFFLQNQFSYHGFAGHVGIRGDYLFLGTAADRAAAQQENVAAEYFSDTGSFFGRRYKLFWSPRLAVNHPITDRSKIHFNFGHFIQWPRYIYYFAKISSRSSEAFPVEGNLNLDPQRSVQFQLGIEHELSPRDVVNVAVYNKDSYDYPTATRTVEATRQRLVYVNSDFARTRGIELEYRHLRSRRTSGHLSYEFLIATGKPADPNRIKQVDPEALETGDAEPDLNEEFMPWNRPYRLQASIDFRFGPGDRPRLLFLRLPDRWGVNFFYSLRSGKPFTPTDERGQRTGKKNSANAPFESVLDMKFDKYWNVGSRSRFTLRFELRNVLDNPSVRRVDSSTGEVPTFGVGRWHPNNLTSDVSEAVVRDRLADPSYYGEGRNLRLGIEVSF